MTKVIISGAKGKMGRSIAQLTKRRQDINIVAGVDLTGEEGELIIYDDIFKISQEADVILDFSRPNALGNLCKYAVERRIALVVGTTGLTEQHKQRLKEASDTVPVFLSSNMSLGVFLMMNLAKQAASVLREFDIEIIERHHNQKIDAPSGTALMIADAIKEVRKESHYVLGRSEKSQKREENEIGIHAIRAGNLVGEHSVIFGGENEVIEINHVMTSREALAAGALRAAKFTALQKPGFYSMSDLARQIQNLQA
ncbi:MAG: 4-hydroxy-tetrahydrodipicolinate reductase [Tepidanaerobacteraceae bacterium]|jgi:4-hydroxy-tetrahydrodipicolinate reductase